MATQTTETIADVQRTFDALTGRAMAYKPFHKKLAKSAFHPKRDRTKGRLQLGILPVTT